MPNKTIVAIICLTAIEITALIMGINGALLGLALAAISGLGGFAIGKAKKG